MRRAADRAERVAPGWGDRAHTMLLRFLILNRGKRFVTPEVRHWAMGQGLDAPPNNRAWGNVMAAARKAGLIRRAGHADYGDDTMHTQAVVAWEAV